MRIFTICPQQNEKNEKKKGAKRFFLREIGEFSLTNAQDSSRFGVTRAKVAQLVEQLICNQPVVGSIPIFGLTNGSLPEWLKGTDCKSVDLRLPWFETTTAHVSNLPCRECGRGVMPR